MLWHEFLKLSSSSECLENNGVNDSSRTTTASSIRSSSLSNMVIVGSVVFEGESKKYIMIFNGRRKSSRT